MLYIYIYIYIYIFLVQPEHYVIAECLNLSIMLEKSLFCLCWF